MTESRTSPKYMTILLLRPNTFSMERVDIVFVLVDMGYGSVLPSVILEAPLTSPKRSRRLRSEPDKPTPEETIHLL